MALVRSGEYEQAFDLVLETTPLVGSLGRACYAPCEDECTRGELEGPLPIRRLKRFIADRRYGQAEPQAPAQPEPNGKKVAVVGSGPAGLTAAWQLARSGYGVKIFEAAPKPGGMLRLAIPAYRLPNEVVDHDVANVTAIGVEIATGARVEDVDGARRRRLRRRAAGHRHAQVGGPAACPARSSPASQSALGVPARRQARRARRARRQARAGGRRRQRRHRRGAHRAPSRAPLRSTRSASSAARRCRPTTSRSRRLRPKASRCTTAGASITSPATAACRAPSSRSAPACSTPTGASTPSTTRASARVCECDVVIVAAGMGADTGRVRPRDQRQPHAQGRPRRRCRPSVPHVFAAGDVVTGPTMITTAVGQGRRAAFMIDR